MKKISTTVLLLCLVGSTMYAQPKLSKSDMVKLDLTILAASKEKIKAKDGVACTAYKQLIKEADEALNYQPVSVMEKTEFPPSGDKHDYMSIAPYWWPDPSKPNGVPYMRKDGEINPEVKNFPDKVNMPKLCENVYNLALAYYFSDDEKYAAHASKLLKAWFLDTATKMNPNLKFGQSIKGRNDGRAEGLIDTRYFIYFIDAVDVLKNSKHWSAQDQTNMQKWVTEFLNWMQTSDIGKEEMAAKNNHAVWYDAQALSLALYIGNTKLANEIVLSAADRLDNQLDENGFFPKEMQRTTSFHYTVFIVNAFGIIAQLSENTNTNFWTWESKSGKSLKKAFDTLLPYISKEKEWTGNQIKEFKFGDAFPILLRGATKFNCSNCKELIKKIAGEKYEGLLLNLL